MYTLIAITLLGICCLLLEIVNLRKIIIPFVSVGLVATLIYTLNQFGVEASYYNNMIVTSGFTVSFSSLLILLMLFIVLLSGDFYSKQAHKISDYISIKLFLLVGAIAMISFGNLAMFFLGLEVLSISLYILAGSNPLSLNSNEAGFKYFIMGSFASGIILFGISLIYGAVGSFDLGFIYEASHSASTPDWFYIGVVLIAIGMLFKASVVPFHFWAPDVYEGSPTIVTLTMTTVAKIAALATFIKLTFALTGNMNSNYNTLLIVLAVLSMCVGNIMALKQSNIKRTLAFSGISHAGFMLVVLVNTVLDVPTLLYYAVAYTTASIVAFSVVLVVTKDKETESLDLFKGFYKRSPLLAALFTGALLSMAGIPIFSGFFAKLFIFNDALLAGYPVVVILGVINSIIAVFYYFRIFKVIYSTNENESAIITTKIPPVYYVVAIAAIVLNIAIGVYPKLIMG
ncbi:NADH-quinone oxidoreductase subunit N [Flavobacterium agricola]|uniref:NADH-quinone oxidoreductase subunit N n=1 Tax=Flavobacterium agricola TaxID=2870839 RepID=A0ABY6LY18_9FLAO|nr:NADH-quinone oxidoreductase subunit N [Flavobacterium agricola]UYW01235.1 NADH-quinone oxidoreductase subunit N [Flavobacterium agricola]